MYCPKCHQQLLNGTSVCPTCGHHFQHFEYAAASDDKQYYNQDNESNTKAIVGLCLAIAGIFLLPLLSPAGLALSVAEFKKHKYSNNNPKSLATAGIVFGAIGTFRDLFIIAYILFAYRHFIRFL